MKFISYHGTTEDSIERILKEGFKPLYGKRFGITYGKGIYSSKNIEEAVMYSEDCNKVLICEIDTDNFKNIKKHEKRDYIYDLFIIENGIEYLTDISKIKVIGLVYFDCDIIYDFGTKIYKNIKIIKEEFF